MTNQAEAPRIFPEVHVAGVCVRRGPQGAEVLVVRRAETRSLYPGKLSGVGGRVQPGESFEEAVERHHFEELQLRVSAPLDHRAITYAIRREGLPTIPGVRLLCIARGGLPPNSLARFISMKEFWDFEESNFIPDLRYQMRILIDSWR